MRPFRLPVSGALMAITALFAYASTSGYATVPTALAVLSIPAVLWRGTLPVPRSVMLPTVLVLGLVIFGNQTELRKALTFFLPSGYPAGLMISAFVMMYLYRRNESREGLFLLFLATLLLLDAGMTTEIWPYGLYLIVAGLFLGVALRAWMGEGQPEPGWDRGSVAALAALVMVAALSVGTAVALRWSETSVNFMLRLVEPAPGGGVSFASRTSLQSMLNIRSQRVLARVRSDAPAPYLVGRVYVRYQNNNWESLGGGPDVRPVDRAGAPSGLPSDGNLFLGPGQGDEAAHLKDWKPATVDRIDLAGDCLNVFTSRDTVLMGAPVDAMVEDPCGSRFPAPVGQALRGSFWLARGRAGLPRPAAPSELIEACRQLPPETRAYAEPLAREAVASCRTDEQKAAAIEAYMRTRYTYEVGCPIKDPDPLREFLLEKTPAHCEFFATGMIAMLRSLGIPARYVTGFIVSEYNPVGHYYVVRDEHAHGWVETWFPNRGWIAYDPTPPSALRPTRERSRLREWADALTYLVERFRSFVRGLSWREMLRLAVDGVQAVGRWLIEQPWRVVVLLFLFAAETLFRRPDAPGRRWWRRWRQRGPAAGVDPDVARLQGLLERLDGALRRRNLKRPEHVTVLEWSQRLAELEPESEADRPAHGAACPRLDGVEQEEAVRFLRLYAQARYASSVPPPQSLEDLEAIVAVLERKQA